MNEKMIMIAILPVLGTLALVGLAGAVDYGTQLQCASGFYETVSLVARCAFCGTACIIGAWLTLGAVEHVAS